MKAENAARLTAGLTNSIDRLRATDASNDDAVWTATADVLSCLYRCHEAERQADDGFFDDARDDDCGRRLLALTWFRGLLDHQGSEVRAVLQRESTFWMKVEGRKVEVSRHMKGTQGRRRVQTRMAQWVWPKRADLPEGFPERRRRIGGELLGRDGLYERLIEGRSLLDPINDAAAFLRDR